MCRMKQHIQKQPMIKENLQNTLRGMKMKQYTKMYGMQLKQHLEKNVNYKHLTCKRRAQNNNLILPLRNKLKPNGKEGKENQKLERKFMQ